MKKVLIIANHYANRSPGQRFRFEQYLKYLEENNFSWELSFIISKRDAQVFYKPGKFLQKTFIVLKAWWIRSKDLLRIKQYDIVFIFREAFFTGSFFFEKQFAKSGAKIIFDFDDAIWIDNVSEANKKISFLKNAAKTNEIIKLSDMVFAGNNYLANHASQYNSNVKVIPTTIDMVNVHNKTKVHQDKPELIIGWTGTHSSLVYLQAIENALALLKEKYKNIKYLIISDKPPTFSKIEVDFLPWNLDSEIDDLLKIDIGIMPMIDEEWAKGKCGFKILQYLSLGIPAVATPVGVNAEIIEEGVNGYYAYNSEEWLEKISLLIDFKIRSKMGNRGQQKVKDKFSVSAYKDVYVQYFNQVLERP